MRAPAGCAGTHSPFIRRHRGNMTASATGEMQQRTLRWRTGHQHVVSMGSLGVDIDSQKIYLLFSNEAWKSLEVGKVYPMRITFEDVSPYNGEMTVIRLQGGAIMLAHRNLSSEFVKDFMQRNVMRIFYQGNPITSLSLKKTYAAIGEVINCQREFGFDSKRSPRSFSSSGGRQTRDPFR